MNVLKVDVDAFLTAQVVMRITASVYSASMYFLVPACVQTYGMAASVT